MQLKVLTLLTLSLIQFTAMSKYYVAQSIAFTNENITGGASTEKYMAVATQSGVVRFYHTVNSRLQLYQTIRGLPDIQALGMTPDNWVAVTLNEGVGIYYEDTSEMKFKEFQTIFIGGNGTRDARISDDHSVIAMANINCTIFIYQLQQGKYQKTQSFEVQNFYNCIAMHIDLTSDGNRIVASSSQKHIAFYYNNNGTFQANGTITFQVSNSLKIVKFSRDQKCLAVASASEHTVYIYAESGSFFDFSQTVTSHYYLYSVDVNADCSVLVATNTSSAKISTKQGSTFGTFQVPFNHPSHTSLSLFRMSNIGPHAEVYAGQGPYFYVLKPASLRWEEQAQQIMIQADEPAEKLEEQVEVKEEEKNLLVS